jgi:hypothetical protein
LPLIHHPLLKREREVTETQAEILTTNPRVPWVRGPLPTSAKPPKRTKPTAIPDQPSPEGDTTPSTEED